ncbi:MAG: 3-deoxy-D-manno-octulosonic acid transferase [Bacteroidales bacterium]|nr:3-deoxy-D-manno-octulosonic acid transferase [Bacteroidales bacterium]
MRVFYTIGVCLYSLGVRVAAMFGNAKARLWVEGREAKALEPVERPNEQWIWFHAASLGEFEQGRPVIEAIKQTHPEFKILLSFFSPSGYEVRKNYPLADEVLYLPADTPSHAKAWVQRHHFVAAFFIKYEFWFNYMRALEEANIPLFYVALILKPDSYFFHWYGSWFRKQLKTVDHFFVQDQATAESLKQHGMDNVTVCGDTRFDRVAAIAEQAKPFPEVERFIAGRKCIIAGSTWPPDERLWLTFASRLPEDYCLIIAPHDISDSHVAQIKAMFPNSLCYSELEPDQLRSLSLSKGRLTKILIINTIGILSQLYQYARFVYIGGGFGVNIHNIQEPVTFGCPVIFGPKYKSFKEAVDLVALHGAFPVHNADELESTALRLMDDEAFYAQASATCLNYLKSQVGATKIIMRGFEKALFL